MNWMSHDNTSFDAKKIENEIDEEIKQLKKKGKLPGNDPLVEKAFSSFPTSQGEAQHLEMLGNYSSFTFGGFSGNHKLLPASLLGLLSRILRKVFKNQHIYNLLALEVLKDQEKRIKSLEERLADQERTTA